MNLERLETYHRMQFHELANSLVELMYKTDDEDFIRFASIVSMVYGRSSDKNEAIHLDMVLRLHFPEYYTDYKPFEVK